MTAIKCRAEGDICTLPSRSCLDCTPTPSTSDLLLLWEVMSEAEVQVTDDGQDVRVSFHAKGDGYTPFGSFVTRDEAQRLRRMMPENGSTSEVDR